MHCGHAIRGWLGALSLSLGVMGVFLLALAIPLTIFGSYFWGGFGFHEGPQPTPQEFNDAVSRTFKWALWHRLVPLAVLSILLMAYGLFEVLRDRRSNS